MGAAGGALKVTGEELEKELTEPSTPMVLDVYAQVRDEQRRARGGKGGGIQ